MSSQLLFTILKVVSAGYLIYLGVRLLISRESQLELQETKTTHFNRLFRAGALSNISNPEVTLFYFAFLPQFSSGDVASPTQLLFLLRVVFAGLTFLVKSPVGYFSGRLSSWLRSRPIVLKWLDCTSGVVLIGLGVKLAFEQRN